jgi:cytoskeletal protein CcmA (bactofilin family)
MTNGQNSQSIITSDVEIKGSIKSAGSVQIDARLEGDLNCTGDTTVGHSANIKGSIVANSVSLEGTVNGTITAKDKIMMKSTTHITGDVKCKRLAVEDGVTFVGKCEVNPGGAGGAAPKPDLKPDDTKSALFGRTKTI